MGTVRILALLATLSAVLPIAYLCVEELQAQVLSREQILSLQKYLAQDIKLEKEPQSLETSEAEEKQLKELIMPDSHPFHQIESTISERTPCTECHTDKSGVALKPIGIFNHSSGFLRQHGFYAAQTAQMCGACHRPSYCASCHANKTELKPSFKYTNSPERWFPHRGNYIIQHRIDARIDPTPCFRCHGRQNNRSCTRCHTR